MRGQEHSVRAHEMKLRLSTSIALGLADIHAGGSPNNNNDDDNDNDDDDDDDEQQVYMAHYDLNPRNIALFAGGRPKINDFNIAEFLRYNPATNQTCKFPSRLHEPWWRAPEEMNTTHTLYVDEKVDVYALGNILFHTLTTHSAHGKQHAERMPEVRPLVAANVRPEIPAIFRNSIDPNVQAILQAIKLCWRTDPTERGTAEEVAAILYQALLKNRDDAEVTSDVEPPPVNNSATANDDDDDENESGEDEIEDKHAMGHVAANVASTAGAAAL